MLYITVNNRENTSINGTDESKFNSKKTDKLQETNGRKVEKQKFFSTIKKKKKTKFKIKYSEKKNQY